MKPQYQLADVVWLKELDDEPREQGFVVDIDVSPHFITYVVKVSPRIPDDKGLRIVTEDYIEGA